LLHILQQLGMELSKQVQRVLSYINNIEVTANLSPWEKGRIFYDNFIPLAGEKEEVYKVDNQSLTSDDALIPLRIYRPQEVKKAPAIIYIHGGWFNAGSLETHDRPLRQLANLSASTIISIAYRLAPEHPFPAGLKDCEFAVQWIIDNASALNINVDKISIAGDSAGGALAATVTRKFSTQIHKQLLIYPVTDNALKSASWLTFQNGPILDLKGAIQAWDWYLPLTADLQNSDAIPLLANDLASLPPTFIAYAEFDPLRDDAISYAEKLKTNQVQVTAKLYKGMIHGFFQLGGYLDDTKTLMQDMVDFLKT